MLNPSCAVQCSNVDHCDDDDCYGCYDDDDCYDDNDDNEVIC